MTITPPRTYTTLSSRGLRNDILPMRLYHKAKKLGIWDPRDIDLTQDRQDWQQMSSEKQDQLRGLIMAFQAWEEAKHTEFFRRVLDEAIQVQGQELNQHYISRSGAERDLFDEELVQDMGILLTDPSPVNQARASIVYNMIIEGVLAETGYYSF